MPNNVLTARDWAAIWTAFEEWEDGWDWEAQQRKLQALVNARLKPERTI
jgi:hypothetical protein